MTELVVVTGASGALGRDVVAEFLDRGQSVVAFGRPGGADSSSTAGQVHTVGVDLADRDDVQRAWQRVDELGTVRALVNLAGGYAPGGLADTDEKTLSAMMTMNLATALWASQGAATRLAARGGGAIVNVSSKAGVSGKGNVAYAVSKSAVIRLTELLADELRESRIRVNAVLPAVIDTPANRAAMPAETMQHAVPARAIAKVIAFLCDDDSWPVSGASIPVYGF
jgi:NAD(P)-dependent dehydrogenase (short-subunit alcohol dehydrogenase family)